MKHGQRGASHGLKATPVTQYRYEIVNLTGHCGDIVFPVMADATLSDLRLTHKYPGSHSIEIPLYDGAGVRQIDLDSDSVFLRSDHILISQLEEPIELSLRGTIRPTVLDVWTPHVGRSEVRVFSTFTFESIALPGLYEVLSVSDNQGNRYPVGTIGLVSTDPPITVKHRVELGRTVARFGPRAALKRRSVSPNRR